AELADRACMAYSGTLVSGGQGVEVVVATGEHTELGRISQLMRSVTSLKTPLLRQMHRFAQRLTAFILGLSALTFSVALGLRDYPLADAFMAVVGLTVAAIPEGLPAILTISLAIGVQRMAGRNAIIRRLTAVETLGSVAVICSDKTGTLTRNEMTAQSLVAGDCRNDVDGVGYEPRGAFRSGDEIPFDPAHRVMATLHHSHAGECFVLLKGAPERILEMCCEQRSGGEVRTLDRGRAGSDARLRAHRSRHDAAPAGARHATCRWRPRARWS
ncbi:MAG: HAD-IC family P-type ATPase, partial [Xanthomonadales bacterium]|nr:HAD-IC family P-type ATPase [Xanthomonadales bacterium]